MLEQRVLVVCPAEGGLRPIVAETGLPLGYAWWRPRRAPWWRLRPAVLAVHEQEDEPLLFTIRRWWPFLPWRELRDAEGRRVGYLRAGRIADRIGRLMARREKAAENGACFFRFRDGRALAEVAVSEEGLRLAFAPAVEHDPFAKMLLLGAVLLGASP
jgi:hypothetical protein